MRAFRFRLDRLLHLREAEKRQCTLELAEKRRQFDKEQQRLRAELRRRDEVTREYRWLGTHVSTAWALCGAREALRALEIRVASQARATKAALDEVEAARTRLIEKSREVERYVRLRERQRRQHELDAQRAEQKDHDNTAIERYMIRQRAANADASEVLTR